MLPTPKQFRRWSYPSKFGFVSFFVALAVSLLCWLFPDTGKKFVALATPAGKESLLVGTWKGTTRAASSAVELNALGYTRLLETGEYTYTGEIQLRRPDHTTLVYAAIAAGTWKMTGNRFVLTLSDVKTVPQKLKHLGKPDVDLSNPLLASPELLQRLEFLYPRGAAQEYVILELSPLQLRARSTDLRGVLVTYEATRQ